MFALAPRELTFLTVWAVGVVLAILVWPRIKSERRKVALLVVAAALPIAGTIVAFIAAAIVWRATKVDRVGGVSGSNS